MSFVELVRYLSSLLSVKCEKLAFLSQSNAKIPLSIFLAHGDNIFFGTRRQHGGTSDNPNVLEFYNNTGALRVVNSFCRPISTGNKRGLSLTA